MKPIRLGLRPWPRRAAPWRRVVARDPLSGLPDDGVFDMANCHGWDFARTINRGGYRLPPGRIVTMYRRIDSATTRGELPF